MNSEICGSFGFRYITLELLPEEGVFTEGDAMASMDPEIDLNVQPNGNIPSALGKALFGGESFFLNHFSNGTNSSKRLMLTHSLPGDIVELKLNDEAIFLQPGAFIAATAGIELGLSWAGVQSYLAKEGLFRLKCSGTGTLWFGSFGAVFSEQVNGDYYVDSGHLVAYQPSLSRTLRLPGGITAGMLGGEGIVTKLKGNGIVYLQSRSLSGMAAWLNPHL